MAPGTAIGLGSVIDWDVINRRQWDLPRDRFQICLEFFMDFLLEFCTVKLFKNLLLSQNKGHAPPHTWHMCSPSVSLDMSYPTLAKVLTAIHYRVAPFWLAQEACSPTTPSMSSMWLSTSYGCHHILYIWKTAAIQWQSLDFSESESTLGGVGKMTEHLLLHPSWTEMFER